MASLKLFALNGSQAFGKEVADLLNVPLSRHDEYYFDDGEPYCASLENVRGCDVFVIQSLYSDETESVNDKLVKMLIFLGALHDASAKRITAVTPYTCLARQDRKTSSRAPISTKYMARWLKGMWADRLLALDIHSPTSTQNAFLIPVDLLEAKNLFANYISDLLEVRGSSKDVVVLSPDSGGLDRTDKFRSVLGELLHAEIGIACMYKSRRGGEVRGHGIMGDVAGKTAVIYDDLISSGKTVLECVESLRRRDVGRVLAVCATHGLFVGKANIYLEHPLLEQIAVTDTVAPFRLTDEKVKGKLNVIKTSSLFAEAIKRIHENESISDLINVA